MSSLRVEKLQTELPIPKAPNPGAGAALQELHDGKYGEMSTLNNYMFQSFNFRSYHALVFAIGVLALIPAATTKLRAKGTHPQADMEVQS